MPRQPPEIYFVVISPLPSLLPLPFPFSFSPFSLNSSWMVWEALAPAENAFLCIHVHVGLVGNASCGYIDSLEKDNTGVNTELNTELDPFFMWNIAVLCWTKSQHWSKCGCLWIHTITYAIFQAVRHMSEGLTVRWWTKMAHGPTFATFKSLQLCCKLFDFAQTGTLWHWRCVMNPRRSRRDWNPAIGLAPIFSVYMAKLTCHLFFLFYTGPRLSEATPTERQPINCVPERSQIIDRVVQKKLHEV